MIINQRKLFKNKALFTVTVYSGIEYAGNQKGEKQMLICDFQSMKSPKSREFRPRNSELLTEFGTLGN